MENQSTLNDPLIPIPKQTVIFTGLIKYQNTACDYLGTEIKTHNLVVVDKLSPDLYLIAAIH